MIIDIETVVFRDPVVQIGVLPEKLLTRVSATARGGDRPEDEWIIQLDTEAGELTLVSNKGEPICVPRENVRCYTRKVAAAPPVGIISSAQAQINAERKTRAAGGKR